MYQTQRQARAFIPSPLRDAIQPIWVVATSVWLVGCTTPPLSNSLWGTAPPPTPVELAPAHPRPLAAGSVWVYDKGTVKRLLAVEQAHWVWETQTDTGTHIHHSTPDFFAPALWQKDGRVVSTIDGQPAALWPLSAGRTVV
ncbi:MAG: hypothetical protein RJA09_1280, partial [Pseudomonadota bacterium]